MLKTSAKKVFGAIVRGRMSMTTAKTVSDPESVTPNAAAPVASSPDLIKQLLTAYGILEEKVAAVEEKTKAFSMVQQRLQVAMQQAHPIEQEPLAEWDATLQRQWTEWSAAWDAKAQQQLQLRYTLAARTRSFLAAYRAVCQSTAGSHPSVTASSSAATSVAQTTPTHSSTFSSGMVAVRK